MPVFTRNPWQPIETAPNNNYIEVCGDSGYSTFPHFLAVAKRDPEYRGNSWLSVQNDRLSNNGWEPTHWRYLGEFPTKD